MSSAAEFVYPIAILREQVTALEAAMTLAVADPGKKAVHHLRTTTRRIEAHLGLLSYLEQLPAKTKAVVKAGKVLRRIRRAAGRVRDLDVHLELIGEYRSREPKTAAGPADHDAVLMKQIERHAAAMGETLQRRRERRAEKLRALLDRERSTLAPALEQLMELLADNAELGLSAARLEESTRAWYAQQMSRHAIPERTADDLHATRKAAKMARYLAESSAQTAELALRFKQVQERGGRWHDLETLAETADEELGRKSPLRAELRRDANAARDAYRRELRAFRGRRGKRRAVKRARSK